jgi:hypothetical protein
MIDLISSANARSDFLGASIGGYSMIQKGIGVFTVLTLLSTVASAGSTPKDLYGKSITVQWNESLTGRFETEQFTRILGHAYEMNIYISTAGRSFVRLIQSNAGGVSHASVAGGGSTQEPLLIAPGKSSSDHVDFQGHSIVVYREFQSGARRIAIDFEGAGKSCKATIINGRQAGSNAVRRAMRGPEHGVFDASSIQIGSVRCSMQEGNVFGQ